MSENMPQEAAGKWMRQCANLSPRSEEAQYLKIGKWFSREPLSAFERESLGLMLRDIYPFRPGECYMNAFKIAQERAGQLTFCEGFAAGIWPVNHAWVSYKGRAIDVTWPVQWKARFVYKMAVNVETIMQRVEHNLKNCSYLGIEVPGDVIRDHCRTQGTYSPLFDARFYKRWPEFEKAIADRTFLTRGR